MTERTSNTTAAQTPARGMMCALSSADDASTIVTHLVFGGNVEVTVHNNHVQCHYHGMLAMEYGSTVDDMDTLSMKCVPDCSGSAQRLKVANLRVQTASERLMITAHTDAQVEVDSDMTKEIGNDIGGLHCELTDASHMECFGRDGVRLKELHLTMSDHATFRGANGLVVKDLYVNMSGHATASHMLVRGKLHGYVGKDAKLTIMRTQEFSGSVFDDSGDVTSPCTTNPTTPMSPSPPPPPPPPPPTESDRAPSTTSIAHPSKQTSENEKDKAARRRAQKRAYDHVRRAARTDAQRAKQAEYDRRWRAKKRNATDASVGDGEEHANKRTTSAVCGAGTNGPRAANTLNTPSGPGSLMSVFRLDGGPLRGRAPLTTPRAAQPNDDCRSPSTLPTVAIESSSSSSTSSSSSSSSSSSTSSDNDDDGDEDYDDSAQAEDSLLELKHSSPVQSPTQKQQAEEVIVIDVPNVP